MLNNLSGIAQVQDALETTNKLLAEVLAELRRVNDERLTQLIEVTDRQNERQGAPTS